MTQLEYKEALYEDLKDYYLDQLGLKDFEARIQARMNRDTGKSVVEELKKHVDLKGKKVLEVGSGWGEICVELAKSGANVTGIEPNRKKLEISCLLAETEKSKADFIYGHGEYISFHDGIFDIIVCKEVLEHVKNWRMVISAMVRVVKKGGIIYISNGNYLYPREPHYKIFYPPMFPKILVRAYLRLRGRNPNFINSINFVTTYGIFSELNKYNVKIKDVGKEKFIQRNSSNIFKKTIATILADLKIYSQIEMIAVKE